MSKPLTRSSAKVKKNGRKPNKWVGYMEEGAALFGREMFLLHTWAGRERAYRVRKQMLDGVLEVPGKIEDWELVVNVRPCGSREHSHDGKMSELHVRKRRG